MKNPTGTRAHSAFLSPKAHTRAREFICFLFIALTLVACKKYSASLTEKLEEEKSYTRHAMEYHRQYPDQRRGDIVLDTWSAADYIARDVAKQNLPGEWARLSNQLPFLSPALKVDSAGVPFCVVQESGAIIVLRVLDNRALSCTLQFASRLQLSNIRSGDMEFSGREDYWIYVLKK